MGNHDKGATKYEELFDEVYSGPLFIGEKLLLSHEPIALPFAYNIHGHDHSNWDAGLKHHMNVCAEHIEYTPVNLTRLLKRGLLSKVETIHRATIDGATSRKKAREAKYGKRT
jgi:calcineurin-like phosphoesterase family protein